MVHLETYLTEDISPWNSLRARPFPEGLFHSSILEPDRWGTEMIDQSSLDPSKPRISSFCGPTGGTKSLQEIQKQEDASLGEIP